MVFSVDDSSSKTTVCYQGGTLTVLLRHLACFSLVCAPWKQLLEGDGTARPNLVDFVINQAASLGFVSDAMISSCLESNKTPEQLKQPKEKQRSILDGVFKYLQSLSSSSNELSAQKQSTYASAVGAVLKAVAKRRTRLWLSKDGQSLVTAYTQQIVKALDNTQIPFLASCDVALCRLQHVSSLVSNTKLSPDELLLAAGGHVSCALRQLMLDIDAVPQVSPHIDSSLIHYLLSYVHRLEAKASIVDCHPSVGIVAAWLKHLNMKEHDDYLGLTYDEGSSETAKLKCPSLISRTSLEKLVEDSSFAQHVVKALTVQPGDLLRTKKQTPVEFVGCLDGDNISVRRSDSPGGKICKTSLHGLQHHDVVKVVMWCSNFQRPTAATLMEAIKELANKSKRHVLSPSALLFVVGEIAPGACTTKAAGKEKEATEVHNVLSRVQPVFTTQAKVFWPGKCVRGTCYQVSAVVDVLQWLQSHEPQSQLPRNFGVSDSQVEAALQSQLLRNRGFSDLQVEAALQAGIDYMRRGNSLCDAARGAANFLGANAYSAGKHYTQQEIESFLLGPLNFLLGLERDDGAGGGGNGGGNGGGAGGGGAASEGAIASDGPVGSW